MFSKLSGHMRNNAVAYLALFLALGGTSAYAANTVFSSDIVDGEVKTPDLGTTAVTAPKIASNAVTNAKIAASAVTDAKIATSAVTNAKIATSAVTNLKIGAAAVTNGKLAAGAVTPSKFGTVPAARATKTTGQSVPSQTTPEDPFTALTFGSESFDTAALHSTTTGTEALTAPISGLYEVNAGVAWSDNSTGHRTVIISAGPTTSLESVGSSLTKASSHTLFTSVQTASALVKLAAGEVAVVFVNQDSGSSQTVSAVSDTFLAMHWVGPG